MYFLLIISADAAAQTPNVLERVNVQKSWWGYRNFKFKHESWL